MFLCKIACFLGGISGTDSDWDFNRIIVGHDAILQNKGKEVSALLSAAPEVIVDG
jgi:hypothetical protein